jgi:molybdenum cofactor synthesis domain-containing protein
MPQVVSTAACLLIGNELLSGKTRDENLHALCKTLRSLGIDLVRAVLIKDEREAIAREVSTLRAAHDVVFTSGGVGPTHDDVTVLAVADAFGVEAVPDPELERMLAREYGSARQPGYARMTLVPKGARLVSTEDVRWPTIVMRDVWLLPGVPEVFRMKLSVVKSELLGPATFFSRSAYTSLDETELKPAIDATVAGFPEVEVGSYPKWAHAGYRTQVTFDGRDEAVVAAALSDFCGRLPTGEPSRTD